MRDDERKQERDDRNRARSEEARWQAAEAGAEEEDRAPDTERDPGGAEGEDDVRQD
jgi:hypothetical protein